MSSPGYCASYSASRRSRSARSGSGRRLLGRPGAEARDPRPGRVVGVGLGVGDVADPALDADLALQRLPVEQQRRARVGAQLLALAAVLVGVEHEATAIASPSAARSAPTARRPRWRWPGSWRWDRSARSAAPRPTSRRNARTGRSRRSGSPAWSVVAHGWRLLAARAYVPAPAVAAKMARPGRGAGCMVPTAWALAAATTPCHHVRCTADPAYPGNEAHERR